MITVKADRAIPESPLKPSDCQMTGFYADTETGVNAIYYKDGSLYYFGKYTNIPHSVECLEILEQYEKTLEVIKQCPDLSVSDRDNLAATLVNKDHSLVDSDTAIKFIDKDPSSALSMDLFYIKFEEAYHSWLCSDLNATDYFEQYYQ